MTEHLNTDQQKEKSIANKIIELVIKDCELVHNQQSEAFALVHSGDVRKVFSIYSKGFSDWVANKYYAAKKSSASEASMRTALSTLSGKAAHEGRSVKTHTRIAKTAEGYWLDLCNPRWEAVKINKQGWQVLAGDEVPIFYRSISMQAIPNPVRGGSLDELWKLVNIPVKDRLMVVAWLIECLREDTPHVVLELVGEQGSAKSSTQRLLRMLIDPNIANLRSAPKQVEDVWVGARNSHLISFENISHLGQDYQDALCVIATGGAHATRTLYTNQEESIIELRKPIVVNGITINITAQDLLDRSLHIELPPVKTRLQSKDVDAAFSNHYAQILGALLDEFVNALALVDDITIADEDKPRMIDFAYLGEAVFQANGMGAGEFVTCYRLMRQKGVNRTLEGSPIALALMTFLESNENGWSGKLTDLLALLPKPPGEANWPKSPKGLGDALRRLSPALRTLGIDCKSDQKLAGSIVWHIRRTVN